MKTGIISKMNVAIDETVQYSLFSDENEILMNELIGKTIRLTHSGRFFCCSCDKEVKKLFAQGFCFPCFQKSPNNSECIIRPELCKGHLGEGRDPEWEKKYHVQPHFVYLTAGDQFKVGITQAKNIPSRWIDQGASFAILLAETPNRYEAGMLEVALKSFFVDKTNWQRMLKNELDLSLDLVDAKWRVADELPQDMAAMFVENDEITAIKYPVMSYPEKVKSTKFEGNPVIEGKLKGIKGQYLIFEDNSVINLRSQTGYEVTLEVLD